MEEEVLPRSKILLNKYRWKVASPRFTPINQPLTPVYSPDNHTVEMRQIIWFPPPTQPNLISMSNSSGAWHQNQADTERLDEGVMIKQAVINGM